MKWAVEMKKCNEIMAEMAACQKVYEESHAICSNGERAI